MNGYGVVISQDNLNEILEKIFENQLIAKQYLSGRLKLQLSDSISRQADWMIEGFPTVILDRAEREDCFFVLANMNIAVEGIPKKILLRIKMTCSAEMNRGTLSLLPLEAVCQAEGLGNLDSILITNFIQRQLTSWLDKDGERLRQLLSLSLSWLPGMEQEQYQVQTANKKLVISKERIPVDGLPGDDFCVLIGQDMLRRLGNQELDKLRGHYEGTKGKENFYVGQASYECGIMICQARLEGWNGRCLEGIIAAEPRAGAHLNMIGIPAGISYKGLMQPNAIPIQIEPYFIGNRFCARFMSLGNVNIILEPSGNFSESILSTVLWPLSELMVTILQPTLINMVQGISFTVFNVEERKFEMGKTPYSIGIEGLRISDYDCMPKISGKIEIRRL